MRTNNTCQKNLLARLELEMNALHMSKHTHAHHAASLLLCGKNEQAHHDACPKHPGRLRTPQVPNWVGEPPDDDLCLS